MLQRGIETADMDVRWVSSLSWYFLNFFGLNGLYRLILGGDNGAWPHVLHLSSSDFSTPPVTSGADSSQSMTTSPFAAIGTTAPAGPQDFTKLFKAEREHLELAEGQYAWIGDGVEERVLRRYGKL